MVFISYDMKFTKREPDNLNNNNKDKGKIFGWKSLIIFPAGINNFIKLFMFHFPLVESILSFYALIRMRTFRKFIMNNKSAAC